ncbi:MAG: S9 family peptidase [Xanthomonadales bacterium]|nr:S9 family peptidase [Xanthomonadales bacterium]
MTLTSPLLALALLTGIPMTTHAADADPYLWLEEVEGTKSLDWVKERNADSRKTLESDASFKPLYERLLAINNASDRIPYVRKLGEHFYNFWKDEQHVRGIWRRTTLAEYRKAEPQWETVLDLDALNKTENANWVWKGADCIEPAQDRCLISLSRGGGDAVEVREFDLTTQRFVKDGFVLPEAKSALGWKDRDTLYLGTDFGAGSMTESGYPRTVHEWKRGTPWKDAKRIFEAKQDDVYAFGFSDYAQGARHDGVVRVPAFFRNETHLFRDGLLVKVPKPDDAEIGFFQDFALLTLRSDWKPGKQSFAAGSLVAIRVDDLYAGKDAYTVLFTPTEKRSLESYSATRHAVLLNVLDNVRGQPEAVRIENGKWQRKTIAVAANAAVSLDAVEPDDNDAYFMTVTDFLTPTSLSLGTVGKRKHELLKRQKEHFRSAGLVVEQHEATSKDGTRVPYFLVLPKARARDGGIPTLLYGYGGFEVSQTPGYYAAAGAAWLERGGAFVLANIRGGGEFGPRWHQAALKANRQRAYDDFIAIGEDLIARKITSTPHLGIQGGSNGGLLMGVMYTQRPDLWGAVLCEVPLLDMRRYNTLLAGASWMGEYGDPDVAEEWAYIAKYSPYHNVGKDQAYPPILFTTSTRDDRVHPGHARKMAAKLIDLGKDVTYYENIEGGHGGSTNNQQAAYMDAIGYVFLWERLQ